MRITVAIPCYNGERFLASCLDAVLTQTRRPDEVLVIDDGSRDRTAAVAATYPIRLVRHSENRGLSAARNTALAESSGEAIVYIDADACADPQLVAVLESELSADGVAGAGGQGIEAVQLTVYDRWRRLHASQGYGQSRRPRCEHLFGLCMAYRRSALLAVCGFSTRFRTNAEDMDVGLRLNDAKLRLVYTPEAVVYHQRRDGHASLRQTVYQWYYWAYIALRANGRNPWRLAAGTIRRVAWSDTWADLLCRRDPVLARLDIEMTTVKLRALTAAARTMRADTLRTSWP